MNPDSAYRDASVLVTGASGFIGAQLCRYLSRQGASVTGVYCSNPPSGDHARWVGLDLTAPDAAGRIIRDVQPDVVFHLAGSVQGRRELDAVLPTFENNLAATVRLMVAVQEAGCCRRLVITNSQEEPAQGAKEPVPASPYAASKFAASAYARMFHALYGLPVTIARVFMVYGPGQQDHGKLIPYTIRQALDGMAPELSSGVRKIDWIFVDDVVEGLSRLGCEAGVEGQTIDLGSGKVRTIRATVDEILNQIDPGLEGRFGAVPDRAMEQEPIADVARTKARLGWHAEVPLEEGLARTIAWYRARRTTDRTTD